MKGFIPFSFLTILINNECGAATICRPAFHKWVFMLVPFYIIRFAPMIPPLCSCGIRLVSCQTS